MSNSNFCATTVEPAERKKKFQNRKLRMLLFIRDGIERRLAAINASIDTLNQQIKRDE